MATLIRKDGGEVSAFQDAVAFNFAFNGQDGIAAGVGEECGLDTTETNKIRIKSGMAVIQGRQVEFAGNDNLQLEPPGGNTYKVLVYLEIDMATNIATIKKFEQTNEYPSVPTSDNLNTQPTGKAYLGLYTFTNNNNGVNSITKIAKRLEPITFNLGETSETAYPGDKGKANRNDINVLKTSKAPYMDIYAGNLNDLPSGSFYIRRATGNKNSNYPANGMQCSVFQFYTDEYYKEQIVVSAGGTIYTRNYDGWRSDNKWSEWIRLATSYDVSSINTRLDNLGFKKGSVSGIDGITLTKQAKYAIMKGLKTTVTAGMNRSYTMSFTAKEKTIFASGTLYGQYQTRTTWTIFVEGNQLKMTSGYLAGGNSENVNLPSLGFEIQ